MNQMLEGSLTCEHQAVNQLALDMHNPESHRVQLSGIVFADTSLESGSLKEELHHCAWNRDASYISSIGHIVS